MSSVTEAGSEAAAQHRSARGHRRQHLAVAVVGELRGGVAQQSPPHLTSSTSISQPCTTLGTPLA